MVVPVLRYTAADTGLTDVAETEGQAGEAAHEAMQTPNQSYAS